MSNSVPPTHARPDVLQGYVQGFLRLAAAIAGQRDALVLEVLMTA